MGETCIYAFCLRMMPIFPLLLMALGIPHSVLHFYSSGKVPRRHCKMTTQAKLSWMNHSTVLGFLYLASTSQIFGYREHTKHFQQCLSSCVLVAGLYCNLSMGTKNAKNNKYTLTGMFLLYNLLVCYQSGKCLTSNFVKVEKFAAATVYF